MADPQASEMLTALLEKNHLEHALLLPDGSTHSHMAHLLISAHRLNSTTSHLEAIYTTTESSLIPWKPAEYSITSDEDLFSHLGDQSYQRAFIQYFDRRLQDFDNDWSALFKHYLLEGPMPMLGGLTGGFAHPLIMVADAVDVGDPHVAVEALALTAYDWNALHKLTDGPPPPAREGSGREWTVLQILGQIRDDTVFDELLQKPGVRNTMVVLQSDHARQALLGYLGALHVAVDNVDTILPELVEAAVHLLCTIHVKPSASTAFTQHKFDFYLTHQLTFCWCVKTLIPFLDSVASAKLLRMVWLMMVLTYVTQLRPKMKPEILVDTPLPTGDRTNIWDEMAAATVGGITGKDADPHFVKVIRTLKEFAQMWPEREENFLKAAIRFDGEFSGWTGFGEAGEERTDVEM
ncbi:uncharacterized protein LTR77_001369 [Saxophila tyrrhenica]|uniref:Uncharacterized protein n=1 Tax=Saxophila tyrrhenica TaxID=1690608 RepID=A0AAV9PPS9_9PEZI|nr:hypothetical protein LTR77_001369 [Saxophila tyrrhenica]